MLGKLALRRIFFNYYMNVLLFWYNNKYDFYRFLNIFIFFVKLEIIGAEI